MAFSLVLRIGDFREDILGKIFLQKHEREIKILM